jgi:hypothetical protein
MSANLATSKNTNSIVTNLQELLNKFDNNIEYAIIHCNFVKQELMSIDKQRCIQSAKAPIFRQKLAAYEKLLEQLTQLKSKN